MCCSFEVLQYVHSFNALWCCSSLKYHPSCGMLRDFQADFRLMMNQDACATEKTAEASMLYCKTLETEDRFHELQ